MQKRYVVFLLSFLVLAANAAAQKPVQSQLQEPLVEKQHQSPTKARVDTLLQGITLSAEQQPQVDSILDRFLLGRNVPPNPARWSLQRLAGTTSLHKAFLSFDSA